MKDAAPCISSNTTVTHITMHVCMQATKALLHALSAELAPLLKVMNDLEHKGVPAPEYGTLIEWARR